VSSENNADPPEASTSKDSAEEVNSSDEEVFHQITYFYVLKYTLLKLAAKAGQSPRSWDYL